VKPEGFEHDKKADLGRFYHFYAALGQKRVIISKFYVPFDK